MKTEKPLLELLKSFKRDRDFKNINIYSNNTDIIINCRNICLIYIDDLNLTEGSYKIKKNEFIKTEMFNDFDNLLSFMDKIMPECKNNIFLNDIINLSSRDIYSIITSILRNMPSEYTYNIQYLYSIVKYDIEKADDISNYYISKLGMLLIENKKHIILLAPRQMIT